MCNISQERMAFWVQEKEMRGEIFAASLIALQSRCKHVPTEPIQMYGYSWPKAREFV